MLRILLLDDEENIVKSLQRMLRSSRWDIDIFTEPREALRAVETTRYAIIVSDFRMPDVNGVEFLEYCKLRQPEALRLILSAQCDRDAVVDAINKAEIYRFLNKPWDPYELQQTLQRAADHYELQQEYHRVMELAEKQRDKLKRLEREHPDLVRVEWDEDGAIVLDTGADD